MSIAKMLTPPAELQIQLHQFINSQKAKVMITEEKDIQQTLVYIASPNPKPRQSCKISINKKSFTWIDLYATFVNKMSPPQRGI